MTKIRKDVRESFSSKIVASGSVIDLLDAAKLSELMLEKQNFTLVNFSNSLLSKETLQILSLGMLGNDSITSIDIGNNSNAFFNSCGNYISKNEYFSTFLKALEKNPITSLNLNNTNITYGITALADILVKKPLKFLNLSENDFNKEVEHMSMHVYIEHIINNSYLVELNLSNIGFCRSAQASSLARGLKKHPSLVKLELRDNPCGTEKTTKNYSTIRIFSQGFSELIDSLAPSKTLKYLGFSNMEINIDSFLKILTSLEHANNKTLSSIDLSDNPLWTDKSRYEENKNDYLNKTEKLHNLLSWKCKSLEALNISSTIKMHYGYENHLLMKAFKIIADSLVKSNVKQLNFSSNGLVDKDIMVLIKILKPNSSLEELDLSNNNFTEISTIMLEQVLDPHITLLLSNYPKEFTVPFLGKGDVAELIVIRKELEHKLCRHTLEIVESYYNDNNFQSGKFMVLGKAKNADDFENEANNSKDSSPEAILNEIFSKENSKILESIIATLSLSGIAHDLVLEYHGGDFTINTLELVGENLNA